MECGEARGEEADLTLGPRRDGDAARRLVLGQGAYYAATGLWPLLHMRSFEAVTGPKREDWLVKTVGVLVTAIAGTLLVAALLAVSSAVGLGAIDVLYAARGRIARIYLADAVVEAALLALWTRVRRRQSAALA